MIISINALKFILLELNPMNYEIDSYVNLFKMCFMIHHAFAMKRVSCDLEVNLFQQHSSSKYLMPSKLFNQAMICNY